LITSSAHITDPAPSEHYYMLTEDFPEDKKLRQELHMKKLVSDTVTRFSDILNLRNEISTY